MACVDCCKPALAHAQFYQQAWGLLKGEEHMLCKHSRREMAGEGAQTKGEPAL